MQRLALTTMLVLAGCSDVVVGHFSGTQGGGSGGGSSPPPQGSTGTSLDSDASTGSSTAAGSSSSSGGGPPDVDPWQSGCFSDDFDDDSLDMNMWNAWEDGDAAADEVGGVIRFTPPTTGILDAGLVTNFLHFINFDTGSIRIEVTTPPDVARPVLLFMSAQENWTDSAVSFRISEGSARIVGSTQGVDTFDDELPAVSNPRWMGIRAEGDVVHFETSDDGSVWQIEATRPKPAEFAYAQPLLMVQTYGEYPDPVAVNVDNFEACVD